MAKEIRLAATLSGMIKRSRFAMACTFERFPEMQISDSAVQNELLAEDIARLEERTGLRVEVVSDGFEVGVIIRDFALPDDLFNHETTELLLRTTTQYPQSPMDMFWVRPDLLLRDGRAPAGTESMEHHFGRDWKRFSWHRNAPWVPGRDGLLGHFDFAAARLARGE
jgi:hypothetical protein